MDSIFFNKTGYRILPSQRDIEIDRIEEKYSEKSHFYLRVRNNSNRDIKINSFVVLEFFLPNEYKIVNILENNWLQCGEIKYKKINEPTVKNKLFLQRDQNPYSFIEDYGYIDNSIVSEWFTSINFKNNKNLFIGAVTTKDQFSQIYIKEVDEKIMIRVSCQFDGLTLRPGQVTKSEKIFIKYGVEDENKKEFAMSLAHFMNVKKVKKPIKALCASYYWNGNKITDEIINSEIDALEKLYEKLNLDYIQLDAGYTPYFGDWLTYQDRFPNGFGDIIRRSEKMGIKAGIWISPFSINPGTKLHDHHKRWLIKSDHNTHFEGRWTSPVDNISNITDLEVLDPTNEEVKDYLKNVLLHFKNIGFKLFKIDFLYPVCLTNNYSKKITRAQALRGGLEFIKEVLGDDVEILTGITQLSSVVGIADYVRTGIDTLNPFVNGIPFVNKSVNEYMLESNLEETRLRSFLNGVVWRADPDVLVFSDNVGISKKLIEKQKKFVKENNMSMWIGDNISSLNENSKKKLIQYFNGE
jgi:alpha-galactosidase